MIDHMPMPTTFTLAQAATLVSWWKAIILFLPLIPWAWVISTVFDKHAARFYMPREKHGVIHLCVGTFALFLALLLPVKNEWTFLLSFLVMCVVLGGHLLTYMAIVNKNDQVPEAHRLKLDFSKLGKKESKKDKTKAGKVELAIRGPDKQLVGAPAAETPEYEVRVAAESMFIKALEGRASRVELAPINKEQYALAMTIDGVKTQGQTYPAADANRLIDFWKAAAKLDLNERRKKLQGDLNVERGTEKRKTRIITTGTQAGQRMMMLFDPEAAVRRNLDQLGLVPPQDEQLKALVTEVKGGIVVVAAPASLGRTTTFYSVIKLHDAYTQNVQTVEYEIQDAVEGVKQNKYDPTAEGAEHATLVRSILRRDPDVVGVADLTDEATAKEACRADLERSRVYLGVTADGALKALALWVKTVGDAETATKSLSGVVASKLIRKLCVNCKVAYPPTPDMLKKLGLPADRVKQLFKKGGQVLIKNKPEVCPMCQGSGYVGAEGIFEVYAITPADRELIKAGNFNGLRAEFRKRGLLSFQQAALKKAVDGTTSVEEVMRVTADAPPAAPAAAKPAGEAAKPAAPKA